MVDGPRRRAPTRYHPSHSPGSGRPEHSGERLLGRGTRVGGRSQSLDYRQRSWIESRALLETRCPGVLGCSHQKTSVLWREVSNGRYRKLTAGEDGILRSGIFPGLWLDPKALWESDVSALLQTLERGLASPEHAEFVRKLSTRRG